MVYTSVLQRERHRPLGGDFMRYGGDFVTDQIWGRLLQVKTIFLIDSKNKAIFATFEPNYLMHFLLQQRL